ncbi:MAG: NifB/NifX family molybdenum-iron cluster-binding protein [Myxococcota bacterium]
MRIAITTQKANTITGHAGRCRHFTVLEVDARGEVLNRESVDLAEDETLHQAHRLPPALGPLDAFITGSMGEGLFARLQAAKVRPFITTETSPDAAVRALVAGTLVSGVPHAHHAGHHA